MLHTHRFGPADGPLVLALHGLTGHGRRSANLVEHLPGVRMIAPDLRGHGRSTFEPPWNFEQHVADVAELLDEPAVVLGHSFGGAIALHLANARPDLVRGLVLLDPAIALAPADMLETAELTLGSPDYTDVAEARSDKIHSAWEEVDSAVLEDELAEHLVPTRDGRVGWRTSIPAITAGWGELAREFVLPPADLPTILVQAMKVQPPYVTPAFRAAMQQHLGAALTIHEFDCDHMVSQARPAESAALVRQLL